MNDPLIIDGREVPLPSEPEIVRKRINRMQAGKREQFRACVEEAARSLGLWVAFKERERLTIQELKANKKSGWAARAAVACEFWTLIGDAVEDIWARADRGVPAHEAAASGQGDGTRETTVKADPTIGEAMSAQPDQTGAVMADEDVGSAATIRRDMKWAYEHLHDELKSACKAAPSKGAASMLKVAQADRAAFLDKVMSTFAREAEEDRRRIMDDGREQIRLLDEIRDISKRAQLATRDAEPLPY